MFELKLEPRAAYCGQAVPPSYFAVNGRKFDLPVAGYNARQKLHTAHKPTLLKNVRLASLAYTLFAGDDCLESLVKVIPLPVDLPKALRKGAMTEMQRLRDLGVLTELRGGRLTDLARPLSPEARRAVTEHCPSLVELVRRVEGAIAGSDLFIRALKIDEARASTTGVDTDKSKTNLHFDGELTSLAEYPGPIYQYFVNVALLPRQFRILPLPLRDMLQILLDCKLLPHDAEQACTPKAIVEAFTQHFDAPLEEIIIETGSLAVFNGRVFAHDAGKGQIGPLAWGRFVPTSEPDFIIALDTVKTGYHEGYYFPEQS
ncbi:MAG: hypothetical protein QOH93_1344, partial [Chloroflexia bacterium]|nr:hypothetical protein [Chloroflexia bacterium]